jgi:hypothetical protein
MVFMIQTIKSFLRPLKIRWIMIKAEKIRKRNKKNNPDYLCTLDTKRCFSNEMSPHYHYEYFGENTPICCATHLYNILKDVTVVLEKNNLEYFISFGTLLGAVRHGGLIPWDTDTDILISEKDKHKVIEILKETLPSHYSVTEDKDDIVGSIVRVNLSENNTLHIDLFTYIEEANEIVFGYERRFAKEEVFPLKKIPFYNYEIFAPHDIEKQLMTFYGKDYMKYAYKQWALDKTKFEIIDFAPANIEN